jgi:aromatic-L-amino-acid/L-tryptophan decarboxylase
MPVGQVAHKYGLWFHVDATLVGSAAILPEKRWILNGVEAADSVVFSPHKWLFTNFDCSAFFTPHPDVLTRTFSILPEYLKTDFDKQITNFMDWGIQLGHRFRALKLWFVIRSYGVEGLQDMLREHLLLAQEFSKWIQDSENCELMAPVPLQTVCFRFNPKKGRTTGLFEEELENLNKKLMDEVNHEGRIFLTHTKLGAAFCLRLSISQTQTKRGHVEDAWSQLKESDTVRTHSSTAV